MNLSSIAFLSMRRQKGKKLFLALAMILGCATFITLFTFVQGQKAEIESQFDEYGANIVVLPKSDNLSLTYGGVNVSGVVANVREISASSIEKIRSIPNKNNIRAISPKLLAAANLKTNVLTIPALVIGVDFEEERKIKSWWAMDGGFPEESFGVVLGSQTAKLSQLNIGDTFLIKNQRFNVTGVLAPTGSQDDQVLFMARNEAGQLFNKPDAVSLVEVSALCSDCPIDELVAQIRSVIPEAEVTGIRQVMKQKMAMVDQFGRFALSVSAVILIIGSLLVFVTMMASVTERQSEIGIFRAIGYQKRHIMYTILLEVLVVSVFSGILGVVTGYLVSFSVLPSVTGVNLKWLVIDPVLSVSSISGVVLISVLATLYPALSASRVDPVSVLHSV